MIGQGYHKWLSPREQEALARASMVLIDAFFDEWSLLDDWEEPGTIVSTRLGKHLPRYYEQFYTPVFYKKFGVSIVTVAWKLAQPEPRPLASPAEQLAAWAMIGEARSLLKGAGAEGNVPEDTQAFQAFSQEYVKSATFLRVFDLPQDKLGEGREEEYRAALVLESWFHPISTKVPPHPYAWSGASEPVVGRAYKSSLRPSEQQALGTGIEVLIDEVFEGFPVEGDLPLGRSFANTELGAALPRQYYSRYTLPFLKKFTVSILTVAWKLAQKKHLPLSSVAEELAAHAILTQAKGCFELEQETLEEGMPGSKIPPGQAFERFREFYFEEEDFLYLFDPRYDGVDQSPVGEMMAMSSLAFENWWCPFGEGTDLVRLAHPYVYGY